MPSASTRIVLIHGAATSKRVWNRLIASLASRDVVALERPRSGNWESELAWLAPRVEGAFVVGMSGGATLGLGLVMGHTPLAGALLHEPAVGSLLPGLLAPMGVAFSHSGTTGFARALYGSSWQPTMSGGVAESVTAGELAMFRSFEPGPPGPNAGSVVVTTGSESSQVRRAAAAALRETYGYELATLEGAGHFVAHDQPLLLAAAIEERLQRLGRDRTPG